MIPRNLQAPLEQLASTMPLVAVTGPRQSGKTTLCRAAFPDMPYVSLEPLDVRDYAVSDPRGFLHEHADGAILDEIQRAPELLSYLQEEVDERPEPGRFILTGSQHVGLAAALTQTLAGRIAILNLLPPSLDELIRFGEPPADLWTLLWTGSYPRIYDRRLHPHRWLADYTSTYVQRDVRQILKVTDLEAFTSFLRLVAGRTANELNLSSLGGDAGVTHPTARAWVSVLATSFICVRLAAWHRNVRKQTVKSPKLHFLDTGLACHLLGVTEPDQLRHHPLRGALFESWVVSEVMKSRAHRGLPESLFHFRTAKGLEADLLIEEGDRLTAVEAKSAATVASDFFTPLKRLAADVERQLPHLEFDARVVFGGDTAQRRSDATVIPWRQLHDHRW
ncbi:MAG: ATP-binding protein [Gemmatimonadota bacterium]|nr:MAG: ATP-binding protein [Gemmatimonadota bacterium]